MRSYCKTCETIPHLKDYFESTMEYNIEKSKKIGRIIIIEKLYTF